MRNGADDVASSSRSDRDRRRGGPPLGLLGLAAAFAGFGPERPALLHCRGPEGSATDEPPAFDEIVIRTIEKLVVPWRGKA